MSLEDVAVSGFEAGFSTAVIADDLGCSQAEVANALAKARDGAKLAPHHPEARFQSPGELIAHYRAVSRRIQSAGARFEHRRRETEKQKRAAEMEALAQRVAANPECAPTEPALGRPRNETMRIIEQVAYAHRVLPSELLGVSKEQRIVRARWEAMARVKRERPHLSTPQIGRIFNRDHSTVLHALKRYAEA